jgi:hypothetical protein
MESKNKPQSAKPQSAKPSNVKQSNLITPNVHLKNDKPMDKKPMGLCILSGVIPFVGIALYLVWLKKDRPKARLMMISALIGLVCIFFLYFIFMCIVLIVQYNM